MNLEGVLFIITYGRSGSTLLQGMLNSIPGYDIKGENLSALVPLFRSYKRASRTRYEFGKARLDTTNPWYGADRVDPGEYGIELANTFIKAVLKPEPGTRVSGFKEIRYGGDEFFDVEESVEYLGFIKRCFPNARFIFNERNIEDVSRSAWWKDNPNASNVLEDLLTRMQCMYEAHRSSSLWVDYDQYKRNVNKLEPLFDFLGESFDERKLQRVLDRRHSY